MQPSQYPPNAYLNEERLLIQWWFDVKQYTWDAQGRIRNSLGQFIIASAALRTLRLDYEETLRQYNAKLAVAHKTKHFNKELIEAAFDEFKYLERERIKQDLISNVAYVPATVDHLSTFVTACSGVTEGAEYKAAYYALSHWLWQVKRKLLGLPVTNHLMVLFAGPQGCGKSTAIDYLTRPLSSFSQNLRVDALADDRNNYLFGENFVGVCDEMQGGARADIDSLKHVITASELSTRRLGTNTHDKIPQNCSFIGSTNKDLQELVVDETGTRRFYVINCLALMDHNIINSIPYLEIWKAIDENDPKGYSHHAMEDIKAAQEKCRVKSSVEQFAEAFGLLDKTLSVDTAKKVQTSQLYSAYKEYCEENGLKIQNSAWFGRTLNKLKVVLHRTTIKGETKRFYCIPSSLQLGEFNVCN
jgi:Cdc6-like AAA superfamily ATPase